MNNQFIKLVLTEGKPIIICVNNIASITPAEDNSGSVITMNFIRSKDLWPKKYSVKETFEEIEKMIF